MSPWKRSACLTLVALTVGACSGDRAVKFGVVLPLSGPFEAYGTSILRGIEIAFDEAQNDPQLGHRLELVVVDSQSDPRLAAQQLRELYDSGAPAAIGGATSAEALEMVAVADREDRVLLSPSASSPELTGVSRNFFRVFPSDFVEGTRMAYFAAETLKFKTAVILATETPYGRGIQGVFQSEFTRNGGEVLEVLEYPANTSDFSGLIGRVVALRPDVVYLAAYWDDLVAMIRQLKQAGYEGRILTTAAFATPQAVEAAGSYADGIYFTQTVFDVTSEAEPTRSFVSSYRRRFGDDPDLYAAHGYDAMRVLAEALKEGGPSPSAMWRGMRSIRSYPGVTGAVQFDERGDVQKFPRVYVIREGMPVNYDDHVRRVREGFRQRLRELEEQQRALRGRAPAATAGQPP
jgi:branched-chain amino acid transport system substrate-binding protein